MINPTEAETKTVEHIVSGAKKLGYMPYNNLTFIQKTENGEGVLSGVCPLCGTTKIIESLDEIDSVKEVINPNTKVKFVVNSCEKCAASRKEQVTADPKRPLNGLLYLRAKEILESKFNSTLIPVKSNLFVSPDEYVTFKSNIDGKKYKIKLKIVMLYTDIRFEDLDFDEIDEHVFEITDDEMYAILKEKESVKVPFEEFLVNKDRDSLNIEYKDDDESENDDQPETEDETDQASEDDSVNEAAESNDDSEQIEQQENSVTENDDSENDTNVDESSNEIVDETEIKEEDVTEPDEPDEVDNQNSEETESDVEPDNDEFESENDDQPEDENQYIIEDYSENEDDGCVTIEPDADDDSENEVADCVEPDEEDNATKELVSFLDGVNTALGTEDDPRYADEFEIKEEDVTETVNEENSTDNSDESEFTGVSEDVTIEFDRSDENEQTESESIEYDNGTIVLELDGTSKVEDNNSESNNNPFNLFNNLFKNNSSETKSEESVKENESRTEVKDDGTIVLELDGESNNPFSDASEEKNENKNVSPITSEARKPIESSEPEIKIEAVNEDFDDEEEEDSIIVIENDDVKVKEKNKVKSHIESETETNHKDYMKDEAKKIYENDKKWYNNPVNFETEVDESFNELMDEVDLIEEFKNSDLGKAIYEIAKRTNIPAAYTINEDTFELPVVDFQSGVRIICVDCNKVGQMKVNITLMERKIKFNYDLPKGQKYRLIYLYSDCLTTKERTKATIKNIIKIVNRDNFDGRRILTLAGNYTLFYTDNIPVIRSFEAENSSYPQGKPCSKEIGIIALRHKTGRKEEQFKFTAKDFMNYLNKDYRMDMKNHNLYMVASARYVVMPEPANKTVKYLITDYCELSDSILKDGLDHIVGAIIKEHKSNNTVKDPRYLGTNFAEYKYQFEFEFDPSTAPSPSLEIWYDGDGLFRIPDSFEDGQGKCYIRVPEYRTNPTDGYRKDTRLFLPIPFSKMFRADIEKAGVDVTSEKNRRKFIEQLGFIEAFYPRTRHFLLNPINTMKLEFTSSIFGMSKVDLNKFFSGNGVYDGGYDNILFQKLINSSNLDEKTKNMMSALAISKMLKK